MKRETLVLTVGYLVLAVVMLTGSLFLWNAQNHITTSVVEREEAKNPAEIELTLITPPDCTACADGNVLIQKIEKQNVRILKSETIASISENALAMIATYGIERLPALLVKGEYDKENVSDFFMQLDGKENNGVLVIQPNQPVYFDLTKNEVAGLVTITYLTDSSCNDCYDPKIHKAILEKNFGMTIVAEKTVDAQSQEGRAILSTYAIKETPAILLSSQAVAYTGLTSIWEGVGSVEADGTFVFRANEAFGSVIYKNLETGETIRPTDAK